MSDSAFDPSGDARLSLRRYGASPGSHSHAHFQVLWGWQGALELEIEGRGAVMRGGRVAVIPPSVRHDFFAVGDHARCFVLDTHDPRLAPVAGQVLPTAPALDHLFAFLQAQATLPATAAPLLLQSLLQSGASGAPAAPATPGGRRIDWAALQAWVDARLAEPISVAQLASRVHLSPTQFAVRCVAEWGVPPMAWLRARRLAAARRLRDQGCAVHEVAARCGYRSPSALTAALKRER